MSLRHPWATPLSLAILCFGSGCAPGGGGESAAPDPECEASGPLDSSLTVADVQSLGTHNSYHVEPEAVLDPSHAYTQPPLDAQADLGVRAFELDVHLADDDTLWVFHLPALDPESSCPELAQCLQTLRDWSRAHPCHVPFTVWLEPKDDMDDPAVGYQPLAGHLTELDAAITEVWPRDRVITPDDVRAGAEALPDGVGAGWPLLAASRGKAMFALLDSGEHRTEYLDDAPNLSGRVLFVDSDTPADTFAATFKIDDAGADAAIVSERVAAGFLVTSNVDEAGQDGTANAASFAAALESGPQGLASDHVVAQEGSFVAELPGGSPRCLPSRVPEGCGKAELEP